MILSAITAKLKALLRTAADLTIVIKDAFAAVRPNDCRNYLNVAGYDAYKPT